MAPPLPHLQEIARGEQDFLDRLTVHPEALPGRRLDLVGDTTAAKHSVNGPGRWVVVGRKPHV